MGEYVLLYRITAEARQEAMATPEKARESTAKWRAWLDRLTANGELRNVGMPLQPTGRVVRGQDKTVTDGPYAETKEIIGGFSIVEARDFAHAAEIASGCPILERGGSVEVRPVLAPPE